MRRNKWTGSSANRRVPANCAKPCAGSILLEKGQTDCQRELQLSGENELGFPPGHEISLVFLSGARYVPSFAFRHGSLEIVNSDLLDQPLYVSLDKLGVQRMRLIVQHCLFVRENEIQCNLVALLDHGTLARYHFTGVKLQYARNIFEEFGRPGEQFVRGRQV